MINQMKSPLKAGLNALFALGLMSMTTAASAATETEVNDSFATANAVSDGSHSGVIGDLSTVSNDVDFWSFNLDAGSNLSASIANGAGTDYNLFNPVMVLFMENAGNYYAVSANDPTSGGTSLNFNAWETGTYFLSISAFGNSPQNSYGLNQYDPFWWVNSSTDLGSPTAPFIAFNQFEGGSFSSFDYNLTLSGTSAVPVPAAAWLFGSGLLGLVGLARRKQA